MEKRIYHQVGGSESSESVQFFISANRVEILNDSMCYEIFIRGDIYEDRVIELLDQISLSYSAKVMKHVPKFGSATTTVAQGNNAPQSPFIRIFNETEDPKKLWKEIVIYLGCNEDFERVLLIHFLPVATSTKFSPFSQARADFVAFALNSIQHFVSALDTENVTQNRLSDSNESAINSYNFLCEGILDLSFIRDLQLAAGHVMNQKILKAASYLDSQVLKVNELKCARLMTLLKPYYIKAGIDLPVVPTTRSLNTYPLLLSRDSIKEPAMEVCRLCLLKARKNYRNYVNNEIKNASAAISPKFALRHEFQVIFLTKDLIQQFMEWAAEEQKIRLQRKQNSVDDRLEQLKQFKIQLILALQNRFIENGVQSLSTPSSSATAFSSSFWSFGWNSSNQLPITKTSDYQLHLSLREKFAFLDVDEPIVVETQGMITQVSSTHQSSSIMNRKGTVYFTLGNILFYSTVTFSSPLIVVIPMKIIVQIELWKNEKLCFQQNFGSELSNSEQQENEVKRMNEGNSEFSQQVEQTKSIVLPLSALAGTVSVIQTESTVSEPTVVSLDEALIITDISGQRTILKFSDLTTPDYISRVYDLLELLLQVGCRFSTVPYNLLFSLGKAF
jgi:hypothetical protein